MDEWESEVQRPQKKQRSLVTEAEEEQQPGTSALSPFLHLPPLNLLAGEEREQGEQEGEGEAKEEAEVLSRQEAQLKVDGRESTRRT